MSTTSPAPAAPESAPAPIHPTPCPLWCQHRHHPSVHASGPFMTAHCSPQQKLAYPNPLPDGDRYLLRVELVRIDEGPDRGETVMYIQGASDAELDADEADLVIADLEALLAKMKVQRRQMEAK